MSPFNEHGFKAPCKDCKDRHRACHDSCEEYQKQKALWKARGIEESREAAVDRYVIKTNLKIQDMYWRKHKR